MVCIATLASPSHNVIGGVDANCNNASERPRVHSTPIRVGKGIHVCNKLAWFPRVAGQVEREREEREGGRMVYRDIVNYCSPLVVCCRLVSSMTSKFVPNNRLSNVPTCLYSARHDIDIDRYALLPVD